jgi:uncharacterized C2H2 Zn-finger protein
MLKLKVELRHKPCQQNPESNPIVRANKDYLKKVNKTHIA